MSNKKDICPVCNENEKGIKSKMCRPCSVAINLKGKSVPVKDDAPLMPNWDKLDSIKPVVPIITKEDREEDREEDSKEVKVGQTRKNGMFYA